MRISTNTRGKIITNQYQYTRNTRHNSILVEV